MLRRPSRWCVDTLPSFRSRTTIIPVRFEILEILRYKLSIFHDSRTWFIQGLHSTSSYLISWRLMVIIYLQLAYPLQNAPHQLCLGFA